MKLFISPRSASCAARVSLSPGWSFRIVRRTVFNPDRTVDIAYGAAFFDEHGVPAGVLR